MANHDLPKLFDEFVDAMADMGKAVQKLKQIVL